MSSKKYLITGVAGFIGSNLAISLIDKGHEVIGIDNFSYGCLQNIETIKQNNNFKFFEDDILNIKKLKNSINGVNAIIHLAAYKIPRYGGRLKTLLNNVEGTKLLLEEAKNNNISVYIASTSDVYGKNTHLPFSEEHDSVIGSPKIARWSYATSKLFDEQLFYAYKEEYNIQGSIFRFFGSYGPHQHLSWWGGPQSVFITSALKNEPIEIHGNGQQTRSFCYISDTVNGIIKTIESKKADGEIINIGNDEEISIVDLAKKIWKLSGNKEKMKLKIIPYKNFKTKYEDVRRRIPDLTLANQLINYYPKISLDEGLKKTIKWQKGLLKIK